MVDNKKSKKNQLGESLEADNPIGVLNDNITKKTDHLSCEDVTSLFCGLTANRNIPIDVIVKCDNLGKELANSLIAKGALEVMKVTQDYIRNSTVDMKIWWLGYLFFL